MGDGGAGRPVIARRGVLVAFAAAGAAWMAPQRARGQAPERPQPADPAHRAQIDVPLLADDPVAVPLTVSVDHPMDPDHYVKSVEMVLDSDPVPRKGVFRFTPLSGRASVAYQMRSGQGGEIQAIVECSRHGRFESRQPVRVAAGGCAVPLGAVTRETGGSPSVKAAARVRPGEVVPVWAGLKHGSHTGLAEKKGKLVQERPSFFVERMTVFLDGERVSEFLLSPAVSPDPRLRFFVRAQPGRTVRVVFVNNRGQQWEASQQLS